MTTNKIVAEWKEAKNKCKLNHEMLMMAKEMGLNPRSLIKTFRIKVNNGKLRFDLIEAEL